MKYVLYLLGIICVALYGFSMIFYFQGDSAYSQKASGYATLLLFFVIMPLFLYERYTKKFGREESDDENL